MFRRKRSDAVAGFDRAMKLENRGRLGAALDAYDTVIEACLRLSDPESREVAGRSMLNRALVLEQLGRVDEELAAYGRLVECFGSAREPEMEQLCARHALSCVHA